MKWKIGIGFITTTSITAVCQLWRVVCDNSSELKNMMKIITCGISGVCWAMIIFISKLILHAFHDNIYRLSDLCACSIKQYFYLNDPKLLQQIVGYIHGDLWYDISLRTKLNRNWFF